MMSSMTSLSTLTGRSHIVIRLVDRADFRVRRLAALDSRRPFADDVLLAELADQPVAAISLADGTVAADPFRPTAGIVGLLQLRRDELLSNDSRPTRSRLRLDGIPGRLSLDRRQPARVATATK
jgi:hypothetical protein